MNDSFSLETYKNELNVQNSSKDGLLQNALHISKAINEHVNFWKLKALCCAIAVSYYFGNNSKAGSLLLRKKFLFQSHSSLVRLFNKIVGTIPVTFMDKPLYNYRAVLERHNSLSNQVVEELFDHFNNHYWQCHGPMNSNEEGIPLTAWEKKLVKRNEVENEEGEDPTATDGGSDGASDQGNSTSKRSKEECDWIFKLLDILLRVMGIRYVANNIFKNKS
jgi:hypothetical protein